MALVSLNVKRGPRILHAGIPKMKFSLRVPKRRPQHWRLGDIAIDYITLRTDEDPMPPCILLMVVGINGEQCQLESLDSNNSVTRNFWQLMGVDEALAYYDDCAEELTVKSARIGRRKLEALAEPFEPFPEWLKSMEWWATHPEDQPDGYPVLCKFIQPEKLITTPR